MDKIVINGGNRLIGSLPISGSKNAVLPLMILGLLTDETLKLVGTPRLADTTTLGHVLEELGARRVEASWPAELSHCTRIEQLLR